MNSPSKFMVLARNRINEMESFMIKIPIRVRFWPMYIGVFLLGTVLAQDSGQVIQIPKKDVAKLTRQIEKMRTMGLVTDAFEGDPSKCSEKTGLTIGDKSAAADLVVLGSITEIRYLYKLGGPFRTEYTLTVSKKLLGNFPGGKIKVLSGFGPNRKDHRRWKQDPTKVILEIGDEGIFILTQKITKRLEALFPEHGDLLRNNFTFQRNMDGVYLIKSGQLDQAFLNATNKSDEPLTLSESLAKVNAIAKVLEAKE